MSQTDSSRKQKCLKNSIQFHDCFFHLMIIRTMNRTKWLDIENTHNITWPYDREIMCSGVIKIWFLRHLQQFFSIFCFIYTFSVRKLKLKSHKVTKKPPCLHKTASITTIQIDLKIYLDNSSSYLWQSSAFRANIAI